MVFQHKWCSDKWCSDKWCSNTNGVPTWCSNTNGRALHRGCFAMVSLLTVSRRLFAFGGRLLQRDRMKAQQVQKNARALQGAQTR